MDKFGRKLRIVTRRGQSIADTMVAGLSGALVRSKAKVVLSIAAEKSGDT
jgi:hypothetical protein